MSDPYSIRPKLPFWRVPILLATWFGCGLLPIAPGTWGSIAALPFAWLIHMKIGPVGLAIAAIILFFVGVWAADIYAREVGETDPSQVVIDEVVGLWMTLALAAPLDPLFYAVGFLMFRICDILKPWPVGWADQRLKGGFGIMFDDLIAAVYAAVALVGIGYVTGLY